MSDELYSTKVSESFKPVFLAAQKKLEGAFKDIKKDPTKGKITIQDHRFLLIRAKTLAEGFVTEAEKVVGKEAAEMLLYNFGFAIGKGEAKAASEFFDIKDPVEKLSTGSVYYSFVGFAFIEALPESIVAPDETCLFIYDLPNSIEAEGNGGGADHAICFFSAGYTAGWASESLGFELEAVEILCKAKGDKTCRFLMAPYGKMGSYLEQADKYRAL